MLVRGLGGHEPRTRLRIETLEDRRLLSGVTLSVDTINDTSASSASTSPNDVNGNISLRSAIQYLNAQGTGGTISFNLPAGSTIDLTGGQIEIENSLSISGPGAGALTVDQTTYNSRLFQVDSAATVSMSGLTLTGGQTTGASGTGDGGAIWNNGGNLTLSEMTLTHNTANSARGGAVCSSGAFSATGCTFSNNSAVNGGALENIMLATATVDDSSFTGNSALYGGGIYNFGQITINDSTLQGNSTSGPDGNGLYDGGGLDNDGGTANVTASTFVDNSARGTGGGIEAHGGSVTVTNSTFSGNSATASGGGMLLVYTGGTAWVNSSTFSNNSAASGGGLVVSIEQFGGHVAVANTIVAGNTATGGDPDVAGQFTPSDHDLIGIVGNATGFNTTGSWASLVGTASAPIAPKLGPLADNGGPTQTMALLAGSPAINAGDNHPESTGVTGMTAPTTDQRGEPRMTASNPAIDIGAYEAQESATTIATTTTLVNVTNSYITAPLYGQAITMSATVSDAAGVVNGGTVQFFDGNVLLGSAATNDNGFAQFVTTATQLAAGTHLLHATYIGGTTELPSSSAARSFAIGQAFLKVTVDGASKVYGSANPAFSVSYTGFASGDSPASLGGSLAFATPATPASNVGPYLV
ncbi:MAG TPA: choice-of-anchor Q domain-containing protein, partial [Pirellulales bacterium]